jgi:hypothetical protein
MSSMASPRRTLKSWKAHRNETRTFKPRSEGNEAPRHPAGRRGGSAGRARPKVPEHGDVVCYQSKVEINQKAYLVRLMVNETATTPKVITVYRTSKINKYWKATT